MVVGCFDGGGEGCLGFDGGSGMLVGCIYRISCLELRRVSAGRIGGKNHGFGGGTCGIAEW